MTDSPDGDLIFLVNCCCAYLSVRLPPSLVRFAQIEAQAVPVFLIQTLHDVECALAQSLTHGVKEDQNQVTEITWERQWEGPLFYRVGRLLENVLVNRYSSGGIVCQFSTHPATGEHRPHRRDTSYHRPPNLANPQMSPSWTVSVVTCRSPCSGTLKPLDIKIEIRKYQ